jgi:hypothetical protein
MSLSRRFKTDTTLEQKGVGIQFPPNDDNSIPEFFICRASRSNPGYQKVADRIFKPFRRAQEMGALPESKNQELTRQVFAEAGLIGWKNVLLSDVMNDDSLEGFAEYSVENAIALLKNLPEVYGRLIELATSHETFMAAVNEADAKNSAKSAATSSSKVQPSE